MVKRAWMGLLAAILVMGVAPAASDQGVPASIELTPYAGNPILTRGAEGEWDSGFVFAGNVVFKDGMFHMLYSGGEALGMAPSAVGYATSEDGLIWTKYAGNPVLELDPEFAGGGVGFAVPMIVDDTWVVYLPHLASPSSASDGVIRATAPELVGPWTVDDALALEAGARPDWDYLMLGAKSVIDEGDQVVMYYHARPLIGIGRATSPDGITWTKYNDPETTEDQFTNSDPVFLCGESQTWDDDSVSSPSVVYTANGWEMFYAASGDHGDTTRIGYASSVDGIHWTRFGDGPVALGDEHQTLIPSSWLVVDDVYFLYYETWNWGDVDIAVATGTVTWE